jgi:beta-glucosidase
MSANPNESMPAVGIDPERIARLFPADFVWGVATSAFQIEGTVAGDGRGESIWDSFCRRPGTILDASDGRVACEHLKRWESDLDLIASLGISHYRFSIAWPRVRPDGTGAWNQEGLAFYDRLVDGMLARGIQPHVTLYHWDLPQTLQDSGGWQSREIVGHFVEYARGIGRLLGDRAASIATHNEPWVVATLGHQQGIFAPGVRSRSAAAQVAHHLLLSHGETLTALRADGVRCPLGIVLNQAPVHPATALVEDREKAQLEDGELVRWYMDPLFRGEYPEDVWADLGNDVPVVHDGDLDAIKVPLDFLGINYYTRNIAIAQGSYDPHSSGLELTDMGWEVYPAGLTELLTRLHRDYTLPALYITENGAAYPDICEGHQVADDARIRYLGSHMQAVAHARDAGVDVRGYFAWSLLDNFEWAHGYSKRFGIVHVDYETQARTPKASALWYRDMLKVFRERRGGVVRRVQDREQG